MLTTGLLDKIGGFLSGLSLWWIVVFCALVSLVMFDFVFEETIMPDFSIKDLLLDGYYLTLALIEGGLLFVTDLSYGIVNIDPLIDVAIVTLANIFNQGSAFIFDLFLSGPRFLGWLLYNALSPEQWRLTLGAVTIDFPNLAMELNVDFLETLPVLGVNMGIEIHVAFSLIGSTFDTGASFEYGIIETGMTGYFRIAIPAVIDFQSDPFELGIFPFVEGVINQFVASQGSFSDLYYRMIERSTSY